MGLSLFVMNRFAHTLGMDQACISVSIFFRHQRLKNIGRHGWASLGEWSHLLHLDRAVSYEDRSLWTMIQVFADSNMNISVAEPVIRQP